MQPSANRRRFLTLAAASAVTGLAGCSADEPENQTTTADSTETTRTPTNTPETTPDSLPEEVGLETLATGFELPLDISFAPDADRRYIADRAGQIYVHDAGGLRDDPFLELEDGIITGGETGLLGIALHPNFAENRRVFVRYSSPPRSGTPDGYSHTFVLAEFEANDEGTRIDRDSEQTLLEIPEPQGNHNAGPIVFGPEGYLYIAVGDGGAGGDQGQGHVEDWYDPVAGGNGQDVTGNLLGSILRIDVDSDPPEESDRNYAIPDDNPLVGQEGLDEQFAWGLRNPWGMYFDQGDLLVADVGQSSYEEVNIVEKGGNYGWNVKEGTHCFQADDCPDSTPESVRGGEPLLDPIIEYPHSGGPVSGVSVIGGRIYRGSAVPGLTGAYVFADLSADGQLFAATPAESDDELWPTQVVDVAGNGDKLGRVFAFGRDEAGEVYLLGTGSEGGGLHRIVPAE